jgi:prepilin-type N-terminal cleavage/methylation domain-containing protein
MALFLLDHWTIKVLHVSRKFQPRTHADELTLSGGRVRACPITAGVPETRGYAGDSLKSKGEKMKKAHRLPAPTRKPEVLSTSSALSPSGFPSLRGARCDQGFTIIEVLVVIVIMTILFGLAIPGFSRWLPNYRLKGAARDLYSNLQLAKGGAIKERGEWAVEFSANSYRIVSGGANRVYDNGGGDDVVQKNISLLDYGSNVRFAAGTASSAMQGGSIVSVPANPIVFNSRGFLTDGAALFAYMTNSKNTSYAVGTWASGAVILRKWIGSTWE